LASGVSGRPRWLRSAFQRWESSDRLSRSVQRARLHPRRLMIASVAVGCKPMLPRSCHCYGCLTQAEGSERSLDIPQCFECLARTNILAVNPTVCHINAVTKARGYVLWDHALPPQHSRIRPVPGRSGSLMACCFARFTKRFSTMRRKAARGRCTPFRRSRSLGRARADDYPASGGALAGRT
jgi:hypothetical protein